MKTHIFMPYTVKIENNTVVFSIIVPAQEVTQAMKATAARLSETTSIPGFRPGKADYETLKSRIGEMKILEEATEGLVRESFLQALAKEDVQTVGQPYFNMVKMAPDNDMEFTAEIALMPQIKKLADYKKLHVKAGDTEPSPELIEQAKKDLTAMQTKEIRVTSDHTLTKGDKAVVKLSMKKEGVPVEGGEGQNHGIYTAETYYVEGFIEKILGMKEGESRTFTLKFPEEHYQKHLAGQDIEFTVEMQEMYMLQAPAFDDAFAKSLGMKDVSELEQRLVENLRTENKQEEERKQEKEMLELISKKSDFDEIPDILVNQELEKMIQELKQNISGRGMEIDDYLKSIGKTFADIKMDFTPSAIMRIKAAIILQKVAKDEHVQVEDAEVDKEIDHISSHYEEKDQKEYIQSPRYREFVATQMRNKKTMDFLREHMVK